MDKYQAQLKLAQKRLDAVVSSAGLVAPKLTAARGDVQQLLNVVTRFDRGLDYVVFKQRPQMIVPCSLVPFRDAVNGLSLVLNDAEIFDQLSLKTVGAVQTVRMVSSLKGGHVYIGDLIDKIHALP